MNGTKISAEKPEYVSLYDRARGLAGREHEYAFEVPAACMTQRYNTITFKAKGIMPFKVKRLEIALKYGDPKTLGYF